MFDGGSGYWSFSPSISVPIFNAGQLRANLDYAEISRNIQVAQYEKAIQTAFREVVDGLAAQATYTRQVQAQRDLLATSEDYYNLAERRYRTGVDSYLTVLDAQRQLFSVQQQLISDRLAQMTSEVNLFKALGGGWQETMQATPRAEDHGAAALKRSSPCCRCENAAQWAAFSFRRGSGFAVARQQGRFLATRAGRQLLELLQAGQTIDLRFLVNDHRLLLARLGHFLTRDDRLIDAATSFLRRG